ncbi:hypothetical protein [Sinorhizobium fredii]|uniref:hypothetical protein n=1 Tax=Rhizobium fredii TaxID=380 RepID=UPI001FCAB0C9|nr:hypothetical protein [Sinorhizobium fredii]
MAVDLIDAETGEFGAAQARGEGQVEHRPIPDAWHGFGASSRACIFSRVTWLTSASSAFFIGIVFEETEERVDGGKTGIAGAPRVNARLLDVLEEGEEERRIELLDLDARRCGLRC